MSHSSSPCWICHERTAESGDPQPSICSHCNARSASYAKAWRTLQDFLRRQWPAVVQRGSFDVLQAFPGDATAATRIQLHFVEMLGNRLRRSAIAVNLDSFAAALSTETPHPEITLMVANSLVAAGKLLSYDTEVSVLRAGDDVHSALWTHLAHPIAIKICYLKTGAPVSPPPNSHPWHPLRQRKLVKLSPYKGDTQPLIARRDLRI